MPFNEAIEKFANMVRWDEQPKDANDKSIYLGTVLQGFYKSKKEKVGQNESNVYEIVISQGPHSGETVGLWGSGLLNGKFDEIPNGCEVRITYLGKAQPKTPKGRAYQNFKVEYDKESRMPMSVAGPATSDFDGASQPAATPAAAPVTETGSNDGF